MHARRSTQAEPSVAYVGNGISFPTFGFKIFTSTCFMKCSELVSLNMVKIVLVESQIF